MTTNPRGGRHLPLAPERVLTWIGDDAQQQGVTAWREGPGPGDVIITRLAPGYAADPDAYRAERDHLLRQVWHHLLTPGVTDLQVTVRGIDVASPGTEVATPDDLRQLKALLVHRFHNTAPKAKKPKPLERQEPLRLVPIPPRHEMDLPQRRSWERFWEYGWEPTEGWPGDPKLSWERRCVACGFVVSGPSTTAGVQDCPHPTPDQEQEMLVTLAAAGWVLREPWLGTLTEKRLIQCTRCGVERRRQLKGIRPCDQPHEGQALPDSDLKPAAPPARWLLPVPVADEDRPEPLAPAHLRQAIEGRLGRTVPGLHLGELIGRQVQVTWWPEVHGRENDADRQQRRAILDEIKEVLTHPKGARQQPLHVEQAEVRGYYLLRVRRLTPREQADRAAAG
ncbi:hypothetical protein ACFVVA_37005 [Kitasatospora sp. NPDC058048]|uniref:hypothetical protein n=1 Tax=Kitasatospora sp. NPDC058048 TaxID=3346313 RepID=UPI0036DAC461